MADINVKLQPDNERSDRGKAFWNQINVQMKFKFESIWTDAVKNARNKLDVSMKGQLEENIEDLGFKLTVVGPLVDFYLLNIAKGIKQRLRRSRATGLMNPFTVLIPMDITRYLCVMWRKYDGRLATENGKMTFVATQFRTIEKMFSPARFDGSSFLKKRHFNKTRFTEESSKGKPKNCRYVFVGRSTVVVSEKTPFTMTYNIATGFIKVCFYRQNYTAEGMAEDTTLQGLLNC